MNEKWADNLLAATAAGWMQRVINGSIPSEPERELQAAVVASRDLDAVLDALIPGRVGFGAQLIAVLDLFDEDQFLRWLQSVAARERSLSVSDAEASGRLVLNRRWAHAADELARLYRAGRGEFKPALRVCCSLLNLWTRFLLDLAPLSYEEKWELIEDTVTELYPSGPDHEDLWDRAGGRSGDLQHNGIGRARWHHALGQIRRGKGLPVDKLLREMRRDFPYNDKLRYLAQDYDFGGGRN